MRLMNNKSISLPFYYSIYHKPCIKLCLGEPKQCFNFQLSTNNDISYIIDYNYNQFGFNSEKSSTFKLIKSSYSEYYDNSTNRLLNGRLSSDTLSDLNNILILKNFQFYLVSSGFYVPEVDGIIALGKDMKYESFLSKLFYDKLIDNNNFAFISSNVIFGDIIEDFKNNAKLINNNINSYECELNKIFFYKESSNLFFSIDYINTITFSPGSEVIYSPSSFFNKLTNTILKPYILKNQCNINKIDSNSSFLTCFKEIVKENLGIIYFIIGKWNVNFEINKLFFKYNEEKLRFAFISLENNKKIVLGYPFFSKYNIIFNNTEKKIEVKAKNNT